MPASKLLTTLFVRGSIRETVPSPEFDTQTLPPPAASPYGLAPTGMRATTRFVRGSIRATVLL